MLFLQEGIWTHTPSERTTACCSVALRSQSFCAPLRAGNASYLDISCHGCFVDFRNLHQKIHVKRPREMMVTILIIACLIGLEGHTPVKDWRLRRASTFDEPAAELSRIFGARSVCVHYAAYWPAPLGTPGAADSTKVRRVSPPRSRRL